MSRQHRPWVGYLLAAIGVLGLMAEVGLRFFSFFAGREHHLNHEVLIISSVIGFVGFYIVDPKRAEGGTGILRETAVAVIGVIRSGRRSSDSAVVVATPVDVHAPPKAEAPKADAGEGWEG